MSTTLAQIVSEKPFDDFQVWWQVGADFIRLMSNAFVSEWQALHHQHTDLDEVKAYVADYIQTVYHRQTPATLVDEFINLNTNYHFQSGEFDALSYAFYRSAFESIEKHIHAYEHTLAVERRRFTERVGARFFGGMAGVISLVLPEQINTANDFNRLLIGIKKVGDFLSTQGYLRDHFAFKFDVHINYHDETIQQSTVDAERQLIANQFTYALYEMGYPIILPSAVYLYHTLGEAQHHSSRTIEELFRRVGFVAYETDDFDPTDYPSDMVVELWEIRAP